MSPGKATRQNVVEIANRRFSVRPAPEVDRDRGARCQQVSISHFNGVRFSKSWIVLKYIFVPLSSFLWHPFCEICFNSRSSSDALTNVVNNDHRVQESTVWRLEWQSLWRFRSPTMRVTIKVINILDSCLTRLSKHLRMWFYLSKT